MGEPTQTAVDETGTPTSAFPAGIRSARLWTRGEKPHEFPELPSRHDASHGVLHIDVDVKTSDADRLVAALGGICIGIRRDAVKDMLAPDPRPKVQDYGPAAAPVRAVGAFAVYAESHDAPKDQDNPPRGGDLHIQPVEFLCGEGWLVSAWQQRCLPAVGDDDALAEPLSGRREEILAAAADRCSSDGGELLSDHHPPLTRAGNLGLILVHELAGTFADARTDLSRWLETWEVWYFRHGDEAEQDMRTLPRRPLVRMRRLIHAFRDRLLALNRSDLASHPSLIWFAGADPQEAERVDGLIDSSLRALDGLGDQVRTALSLVATQSVDRQTLQSENFQRLATMITSVLLVPTFVGTIMGANTAIPGERSDLGFVAMLVVMVLAGIASYFVLRAWMQRQQRRDRPPPDEAKRGSRQ